MSRELPTLVSGPVDVPVGRGEMRRLGRLDDNVLHIPPRKHGAVGNEVKGQGRDTGELTDRISSTANLAMH